MRQVIGTFPRMRRGGLTSASRRAGSVLAAAHAMALLGAALACGAQAAPAPKLACTAAPGGHSAQNRIVTPPSGVKKAGDAGKQFHTHYKVLATDTCLPMPPPRGSSKN